ncbi:hypothetical protein ACVWYG_000279 [Pedobacter sp. UYEF25]
MENPLAQHEGIFFNNLFLECDLLNYERRKRSEERYDSWDEAEKN